MAFGAWHHCDGAPLGLKSDGRQPGKFRHAIAPGTGTRVPGGVNYREAQLIMEMVADTGRMGSLDLVEVNPALDKRNATARLAVDLVESLFGKSTLMRD